MPPRQNCNRQYHESLINEFFNRSDLPLSLVRAIRKIITHYNPKFYAAELSLASGTLSGLHAAGFIKPTGEQKHEFVKIDDYDEIYRRVTINQWELAVDPTLLTEKYAEFVRKISL